MFDKHQIQVEDLPPDFQDLADIIGFETTLKLIENRSGEGMYIPKVEKIYRAARDRTIRKEFNGANLRELAHKYGLTVTWIRSIVNPAKRVVDR